MAVYQVEEYYIFMTIGTVAATDKLRGRIESYLAENGIDDYEWQDGSISIDGFDSECAAQCCYLDITRMIEEEK